MLRVAGFIILTIGATKVGAQDIYFAPYGKINLGTKAEVNQISFNADASFVAAANSKGSLSFISTESNAVVTTANTAKLLFHEFINTSGNLLAVKNNGDVVEFGTPKFEQKERGLTLSSPVYVTLDPNQLYLTAINKDDQIEILDLKTNMTQARIKPVGSMKNTLFLGFDRFGHQIASINNIGETYNWEFLNQKFLRQLKLQSGEYSGSRSVIHSAATSTGSDNFVISLQEVFIPKGGLQPNRQPERRNMLIAYDWTTGEEKRRVPLRFRADGMAMGPTPSIITYYSEDSRTIYVVNLDKGEVRGTVAVDEKPTAIALADNGELLAVGTVSGNVYLYEVIRNNPAEIRVITPSINRNYGDQVVQGSSVMLEGKVEGDERITEVVINDTKAELNFDGSFKGTADLVPGKNRVRISAKTTQSQYITKDVYLTSEPATVKPVNTTPHEAFNKRVALIIGNADYSYSGKLKNTVNDAKSISATLKSLGFEVMVVENGTYEAMKNAIYAFGDRIQEVDVSMFFYAGHGLEVDGVNYLVPVDADIQSHLDIKQKCIPLTGVLNTMEFANDEGLNMIILDACRNNPFPSGKRGGTGLARVNAPSGTLIAYATDPGSVASDGEGQNGLYTGELVKQLKVSQRIEDIFMNTRNSVEKLSGGKQRPWEEARLKGVFYLK
jgi:hypothetical protein